jgi:DNA-binding Xre family transcriptional regulator
MDLELIRRILVEAKTTGVEQTTAQLKGLSVGYEGVTVASQKTETATESAARKFQRLEGFLDPAARAARQLAKDISVLDQAFAQGAVSAERHAQLLSATTANALKMSAGVTQATGAQKLWAEATAAANAQAQMFASRAGGIGSALSSLSGGWLAAAAGVGLVVTGLKLLVEQSHAVAEKAVELKKFVDVTGLSAAAVQVFRKEGAALGIGSDEIETKLQKLSVAFEDLRFSNTEALKVLQRYNPEAAKALESTSDFAAQITIFSKAFDNLSTSAQNAIGKAFIGRGPGDMIRLLKSFDLQSKTTAFEESGRGLSTEQIEILSKLDKENKILRNIVSEGWAKLFAPDVLQFENLFLQGLIGIGLAYKANKEAAAAMNKERKEAAAAKAEADDEARLALLVEQEKGLNEQIVNRRRNTEFLSVTTERLRDTEEEIQRIRERQAARQAVPAPTPAEAKKEEYTVEPGMEKFIAEQKEYAAVLGALLPVQDAVDLKENQLAVTRKTLTKITDEQVAALRAQTELQAELAQVAPGTYERQLEYLKEIKAQYPDMTAQQALAAQQLDHQLQAAQAVTGAEKMSAQYAVDYATATARGATETEASAEAAKKQVIAQAQITAGAKE